jgi:cell wall-associated NlpC family hydrolase
MPSAMAMLVRPLPGFSDFDASWELDELELLQDDVDIDKLVLDVVGRSNGDFDARESLLEAEVEVTITGASNLTLTFRDPDRVMLRMPIFALSIEVEVRGWHFRLVKRRKIGENLQLTFDVRAVADLRDRKTFRKAVRGKINRAQFMRSLVRDIKHNRPDFICPEINDDQPIERIAKAKRSKSKSRKRLDRDSGLGESVAWTGRGNKTESANKFQRAALEEALDEGVLLRARRKVLVCGVMTIIQESRAKTGATNGPHVGLFQQNKAMGWPATRDPTTDSHAFWERAIEADRANPNLRHYELIETIQRSGQPGEYLQWRESAERIVDDYLGTDDGVGSRTITRDARYEFRVKRKGVDGKPENYWTAGLRLADEVQWRLFAFKNRVYFMSEQRMIKSKIRMTIAEGKDGVEYIDFEHDSRRLPTENQTMDVEARMALWIAPPGSVVLVTGMGEYANGRWLVESIRRSLFDRKGRIVLRQPMKKLPEPAPDQVTKTITEGTSSSKRDRIIEVAESSMTSRTGFRRYSQPGTLTAELTPGPGKRSDCSQWTRAVFLKAGLPDIGSNTWAQIANGRRTRSPKPGDLMFPPGGGHVEIYLGAGKTIGHGSPPIDYGDVKYWSGHYFVTFDFLEDDGRYGSDRPRYSGPAPQTRRPDF